MKDDSTQTEITISVKGEKSPISLKGALGSLHDNPQKIQQLLDLLELPKGTEVHVVTSAASVIVR